MELYLITGFLGAGKTTFLRQFVRMFEGKKLWLIINEFGKAGVDGALLEDLHAVMSEINNGSIFCACRLNQFEDELNRAMEEKPDVILVEASGLADPTSVQTVLGQPQFEKIRYQGSICLVDTPRLEKVLHTARVCPKQLMVSSLILLNKTDLATEEQKASVRAEIEGMNPAASIRETTFGAIRPEWMKEIHPLNGGEEDHKPDLCLQKQLIEVDSSFTAAQLKSLLRMLVEDTWRVKGVMFLENRRLLVDCVGPVISISDTEIENENINQLVLLAGPGMQLRKAVKRAVKWYPGLVREVWES